MNAKLKEIEYPGEKLYTIGTVSKLTGVGAITLRAWERRYGLIQPVRKESGHRLYTRSHIDEINRITALTQEGVRISQISPEMLESGAASDKGSDADIWNDHLNSMMAAIISFDEQRLEEVYNDALSLYPISLVTRRLLTPLLIELGLRWASGDGNIAEEHFFAFYLRNKLGARYHHRPRGTMVRRYCWLAYPENTTRSVYCCSHWPLMRPATGLSRWAPICRCMSWRSLRPRKTVRPFYFLVRLNPLHRQYRKLFLRW